MRRPGQILHAVLSKQRPALLPQVLYTEVVLLLGAPTVACVLADVFSYTIDMCTAPALKGAQPQPRTQTRGAPAVKLARCRGCAKTDRRRESIGSKLQAHTPTRIPSARERPPRRRARLCARPGGTESSSFHGNLHLHRGERSVVPRWRPRRLPARNPRSKWEDRRSGEQRAHRSPAVCAQASATFGGPKSIAGSAPGGAVQPRQACRTSCRGGRARGPQRACNVHQR